MKWFPQHNRRLIDSGVAPLIGLAGGGAAEVAMYVKALLLTLIVAFAAEAPSTAVSTTRTTSPSLPPARVADCVGYALLDDKCTAEWYGCKRSGAENRACIDKWETCCSLPGQGARSRLGSAQPVTSNRR
jgi:hypothetical protein